MKIRYWLDKSNGCVIEGFRDKHHQEKIDTRFDGALTQIYFSVTYPFKCLTLKTAYFDDYGIYHFAKAIKEYEWENYMLDIRHPLTKEENHLLDRLYCTIEDAKKVLDVSSYLIINNR